MNGFIELEGFTQWIGLVVHGLTEMDERTALEGLAGLTLVGSEVFI